VAGAAPLEIIYTLVCSAVTYKIPSAATEGYRNKLSAIQTALCGAMRVFNGDSIRLSPSSLCVYVCAKVFTADASNPAPDLPLSTAKGNNYHF
jgi:hypothetical protein